MVRYRAPSSSVASSSSPPRKPFVQWTKKAHVTTRRFHPIDLHGARGDAKVAVKRLYYDKHLVVPCHAYVGNIGPNVDERMLMAHFRSCGKVLAAEIHSCGGVAMTSTPVPAGYLKNMPFYQYGIVTFGSKAIRQRAMMQDDTLDNRKLTVAITIAELPEVLDKISKRLNQYRARQEPLDVDRAERSALRSLRMEPTVLLDPGDRMSYHPPRSRLRFMGVSLPEGIL